MTIPNDRTASTLMGPTTHPDDHNLIADTVNQLRLEMDGVLASGVPSDIRAAILSAIADGVITPEAIGAMPDDAAVLTLDASGRLRLPEVATDSTPPPAGSGDIYAFTGGKIRTQVSSGAKTELAPAWTNYFLELATTTPITIATLSDILTTPANLDTLATYDVELNLVYESIAWGGASGGQLHNAFTVPGTAGTGAANSKGHYGGGALNNQATGTTGSAADNHVAHLWSAPHLVGGRGIGSACHGVLKGTLKTGTTAGVFKWRARQDTADAANPLKLYGADEPNGYGPCTLSLIRKA